MTPASPTVDRVLLAANARMPSQRAQSLQVAQMSAAFARGGAASVLLHARRTHTPALPDGQDLFDYYHVPPGARPAVEAVPCVDWIDRVPRALQYVPARVQELTFARNAARRIASAHAGAAVIARDVELGCDLARRHWERLFLEIHRVPGGTKRREWLQRAAAGALGVIAISEGVREDLDALGIDGGDVRVEHDGYQPPATPPPARGEARWQLGLGEDERVVVYTGGLLEWKGVDLLVEAARELAGTRVVIAGGMDADVDRLHRLADGIPNVRVDGFQPPERVPLYLAAGDVGVVPNRSRPAISARYTSPLKVFEAMGAGLPLVASDLPSLRAILAPDVDAVLVPPDDASALAEGLRRVLDDDGLRARLAARSLERAPEHTWDARAERLLEWMGARGAGR